MQKFGFWWSENRSARSKFHCIGIGFKAIIKGRNTQHLIRVMKVEVLWWLSGRAPATLGIVNWPLNTGWRFFFSLHVRESGNLLLVESGILEVILLMESGILSFGIRNTVHDWNPESKFYWQILESSTSVESGIHSVESRIQDCSGFRKPGTFYCWIRNHANVYFRIWSPGLWNPNYSSINTESH